MGRCVLLIGSTSSIWLIYDISGSTWDLKCTQTAPEPQMLYYDQSAMLGGHKGGPNIFWGGPVPPRAPSLDTPLVAWYMYSYWTVTVRTFRLSAWGLMTNTGNSPPIQKGAPAVMQHCLITASRRTANVVSCALKTKPTKQCWFWTHLSHGLTKACALNCLRNARISYLSHSAQIQIFHNISMFAM